MGRRVEWYLGSVDGLASLIATPLVLGRLDAHIEGRLRSTREPAYADVKELLGKLRAEGPGACRVSTPAEARAADIVHDTFMYLSQSWPHPGGGLEFADESMMSASDYRRAHGLIQRSCKALGRRTARAGRVASGGAASEPS